MKPKFSMGTRFWVILGGIGVLTLILAAYANLFMVSFQSQPECVPHTSSDDAIRSGYTAAKSSC